MMKVNPRSTLFCYNFIVPAEEPGVIPGLPRNGEVPVQTRGMSPVYRRKRKLRGTPSFHGSAAPRRSSREEK